MQCLNQRDGGQRVRGMGARTNSAVKQVGEHVSEHGRLFGRLFQRDKIG